MRMRPEFNNHSEIEQDDGTSTSAQSGTIEGNDGTSQRVALMPFKFDTASVRIVFLNGTAWFVGADVCKVLGIVKARNALARLDEDEKRILDPGTTDNARDMTLVSESGVYALVLTSRNQKPACSDAG